MLFENHQWLETLHPDEHAIAAQIVLANAAMIVDLVRLEAGPAALIAARAAAVVWRPGLHCLEHVAAGALH